MLSPNCDIRRRKPLNLFSHSAFHKSSTLNLIFCEQKFFYHKTKQKKSSFALFVAFFS